MPYESKTNIRLDCLFNNTDPLILDYIDEDTKKNEENFQDFFSFLQSDAEEILRSYLQVYFIYLFLKNFFLSD